MILRVLLTVMCLQLGMEEYPGEYCGLGLLNRGLHSCGLIDDSFRRFAKSQ